MPEIKRDSNDAVVECWYSPSELLEILSKFKALRLGESGELEVLWGDEPTWCTAQEYWNGSFTRQLLELMEAHLNREKVFIATDD